MNSLLRSPDRVTRAALFGIRFRDEATGAEISEGLKVTLFPESNPKLRVDAFRTRSGAFAAMRLPGLQHLASGGGTLDNGEGDEEFWTEALGKSRPYVVEVRDLHHRFLAFALRTSLPAHGCIAVAPELQSPLPTAHRVPLFSAPTRPAPSAIGVIRVELRDAKNRAPLAGALVRVEHEGEEIGYGFADERGKAAVMFPYPEPTRQRLAPPDGSHDTQPARRLFDWDLSLRIHWGVWGPESPTRSSSLPDLGDLLEQRNLPAGRALSRLSPRLDLGSEKLLLGRETVVRTKESDTKEYSCLYVARH
ncbi:MAG TPA: hypothetical protein VI078_14885 [bacterium]